MAQIYDDEDIEYVDDPFEETAWQYPTNNLERKMLDAVGRKRFPSEARAKNVHAITTLTVQNQRKFPDEYIEKQIAWARGMNKKGLIITLDKLISAIRNPDNLARFMREQETVVKDKEGDDELPDYSHLNG